MEQVAIHIGDTDIEGELCPICPGHMVIWPPSTMQKHLLNHAGTVRCLGCRKIITRVNAYGRTLQRCLECTAAYKRSVRRGIARGAKQRAGGGAVEFKDNVRAGLKHKCAFKGDSVRSGGVL